VEPATIDPATTMAPMDDAARMDQPTTNAPDPVETVMIGMAGDVIMMEVPTTETMSLNSIQQPAKKMRVQQSAVGERTAIPTSVPIPSSARQAGSTLIDLARNIISVIVSQLSQLKFLVQSNDVASLSSSPHDAAKAKRITNQTTDILLAVYVKHLLPVCLCCSVGNACFIVCLIGRNKRFVRWTKRMHNKIVTQSSSYCCCSGPRHFLRHPVPGHQTPCRDMCQRPRNRNASSLDR
jgi:hypothetical protein